MAEYIKRDVVMKEIMAIKWMDGHDGDMAMAIAASAPAADVAPVVRCKDCAHRTEMGNCGHPRYHGILPSAYPYDFCSYGERMDGDSDAKAD